MMLKMAAVALLLLCCFVIASTASEAVLTKYAAEGQTIAVPLNYKLKGSETLKWKLNDTRTIFHQKLSGNVITGNKDDVYQNGSLKLTNVKKTEIGKYTPEVHDANGKLAEALQSTILYILDSFPEPEVKFKCLATNTITISCNVTKVVPDLIFTWRKNKKEMKGKDQILKLKAKEVENKDSFECEVSNQALSKTSKAVQQTCTNTKLFGLDFWVMIIILAGGGGLVLMLIIIVIVCCVRNRKKKSMKVKEEEELRLEWSSSEKQHHHHHHHHDQHNHSSGHHHPHQHHQQQPAGHTGPRQHRHKQQRDPRSKVPDPPNSQPQPNPRRAAQAPRPVINFDDEQPPPLPQPRKKAPKTPRM